MLRDLKSNDRGIVFVTVLIIIIVSMVLAVSVLSMNISQVKSSEDELKYIQAKILADGGLSQILVNQFGSGSSDTVTYQETLGNTVFTIDAQIDRLGAPLPGSSSVPLDIDVTF